jgi:glycosyltransferase involved in cell wall biosynthesis
LQQQTTAPFEPVDPDQFSRDLAAGINRVVADKDLQISMAAAGRKRVEDHFDWKAIAQQTAELYSTLKA